MQPSYRRAGHYLRSVGLVCLLGGLAFAGPETKAQIEQDLAVAVVRTSAARARPGVPLHLSADLVNRSKTRAHLVIEPGNGCGQGLVEPHVTYTARYTPHDGRARDLVQKPIVGM